MRRKNPHPKRAVNARTVLKVLKGRRDKKEEEGEEPLVLCLRIPDDLEANHHQIQKEEEEEGEENDDDVEQLRRILCVPCDDVAMEQNQMRKEEETAFIAKGVKRKRGHECDVCGKMFRVPAELVRHTRAHTNEKPYECDVCDKAFSESGSLKTHMYIHTNEKPYECDVCDKAFRQLGNLKRHM